MKAALLTGIGGLDKLVYSEIETPPVKSGYALVKVKYCGVNHLDILIRQGKRQGPRKFPHVLGSEIVGEVAGEKVAVFPWIFCGKCKYCKNGNENLCDNGGSIGRTQWGGYAQYAVVPIRNLIKIPSNIANDKICTVLLAGATAQHLVDRANIKDGSSVLVTGATGGVGTILIQILKNKKCIIVCATSHPYKKGKLLKLGADYVVSTQNLVSETKNIFPQGVNYVFDIVGGSVWSNGIETLGKNGTLVFCSTSRQEPGKVNLASAFARQVNILGSSGGTIANLKRVIALLKKGIIKPVIAEILPLKEAKKAHEKIEKQEIFGKILLAP